MTTQTSTKWNKIRFGDLLEATIKVPLKKGDIYDSLPMDLVSNSSKFPESFEPKVFNGSGTRFADGDTVFARITPCLQNGKIAKIKNLKGGIGFGSTEFFIFRAKEGFADSDYIFYVAKTAEIRGPAEKSMTGASGRQRADKSVVENVIINAPDFSTQKQIADVLSAHDDLIENNNRRIKILEDIAQKIYMEWFVNFRFPGYDKTKFGKDGLPEGWTVEPLDSVATVQFGYNYKAKGFTEEPVGNKVVRIRDILNGDSKTFSVESVDSKYQIEVGDILIGMDGIFHMRIWSEKDCYLVQRVAGVRSSLPSLFLIESIKKQLDYFQKTIMGATVGHLSNGNVRGFKIILPKDRAILDVFENLTKEVIRLEIVNRNLQKSLDLLIPQLVTGKLEIKP